MCVWCTVLQSYQGSVVQNTSKIHRMLNNHPNCTVYDIWCSSHPHYPRSSPRPGSHPRIHLLTMITTGRWRWPGSESDEAGDNTRHNLYIYTRLYIWYGCTTVQWPWPMLCLGWCSMANCCPDTLLLSSTKSKERRPTLSWRKLSHICWFLQKLI